MTVPSSDPPGPASGPGTRIPPHRRLTVLTVLTVLVPLAVPVNLVTAWSVRHTSVDSACGQSLSTLQGIFVSYVPLAFVLLGVGCTTAGIVVSVRGRRLPVAPLHPALVLLAVVGLSAALVTGVLALLSPVGFVPCF